MNNFKIIIQLIRAKQYIKNLFIFAPIFFAGTFVNLDLVVQVVIAFCAFSFAASGIYILNDYLDIEADRLHPKKKFRPLAAGTISTSKALTIMLVLVLTGMSLMAVLSLHASYILLVYIIMNIAYSLQLKHITILDINIIAIGFVLRIFVGSQVTNTPLSMWIVIMTFLLALFMALAKRRDDVILLQKTGQKMRKVINGYNLQMIDAAMMIMASVVIMAYIMYTTSSQVILRIHNDYLYLTAIFVIIGIMRYLQIVFIEQGGGSPTKIALKDRFIQLTVVAWILAFVWIIYL
ncbi:MAG: decaprenyl-phosphate phosphoribosyltransferase [Proteobacteria bacterium]|nr:decaprenyl-phosphate phosphoribosyltransferase [Pseudomonadota bacterium]